MQRVIITASILGVGFALSSLAQAETGSTSPEERLEEGLALYSEELEFEQAAEVFSEVAEMEDASSDQALRALEYLAASQLALDRRSSARDAVARLLTIDRDYQPSDPSHSPGFLNLVDEVRDTMPPPEQVDLDGGVDGGEGDGRGGDGGSEWRDDFRDEYSNGSRPTPFYQTWWFWTATVAVVAAVTVTVVVLTVPGEEEEPPHGSLEPGIVRLDVTGIRF